MSERKIPIQARPPADPSAGEPSPPPDQAAGVEPEQAAAPKQELGQEYWQDRALRLQAEMENYRKRQRRLLEEEVSSDRARLLGALLEIVDDMQRVLSAESAEAQDLRQGIALTQRKVRRLLDQEQVEEIAALGQPFDPAWHEAVGGLPHERLGSEPNTVVEVVQKGYRLGSRLLRPARVIVAT